MANCEGKAKHQTHRQAKAWAQRVASGVPNYRAGVYRCGSCGFWHVGMKRRLYRQRSAGHVRRLLRQLAAAVHEIDYDELGVGD